MRIELNLPDYIVKAIEQKASAEKRSRKNYLETLLTAQFSTQNELLNLDEKETPKHIQVPEYQKKEFGPLVSYKPKIKH